MISLEVLPNPRFVFDLEWGAQRPDDGFRLALSTAFSSSCPFVSLVFLTTLDKLEFSLVSSSGLFSVAWFV